MSTAGPGTALRIGDPGPVFFLPDEDGTQWSPMDFDVAGKPVLLLFQTGEQAAFARSRQRLLSASEAIDGTELTVFQIDREAGPADRPVPAGPGIAFHHLSDAAGKAYQAHGVDPRATEAPLIAIVLDANYRVADLLEVPPESDPGPRLAACLSTLERERTNGSAHISHPPVLIVPRALEPADCPWLIGLWHEYDETLKGQGHSGVDEPSKRFLQEYGRIRQYHIREPERQRYLDAKVGRRVVHEISKAFETRPTKRESYVVSRYDAADEGHLRPHRDCATPETRHRRFTVSVMLNDGEFEGGRLRFREYGDQLYHVPNGTAIVWSAALLHELTPVTEGSRFVLVFHLYGRQAQSG